ncbi:CalU12 [Streptomyces sp. AA4]|nr:CalU12 [Streptomyces sp. AA4]
MWPAGASEEYVAARMELAKAERALRDRIEEVAAARRRMPPGRVLGRYSFAEGPADLGRAEPVRETALRELFGEHRTLVVYHLMFHPDDDEACPMCSMWVDGFRGVTHHLAQHAGFAVIGKAPLPKLRAWAARRGWSGLRILSSHGTSFNADLHAERANGDQRPMISVFTAEGEAVRHFYSLPANFLDDSQRGIDLLSPVWNVLDLLPGGRGEWYAGNDYA